MKKSFKLLKNITGISCPFFGVSWNPSKSDREKIKKLLTYLEDRRVLFNPYHLEVPIWVSESIIDIRARITELLSEFDENSEVVEILRTIRSACRRYLDQTYKVQSKDYMERMIIQNLIEFRSVFGICVAKLSIMYGIDLEEEITEIIPLLDDEDCREFKFDQKTYRLKKSK